MSCPLLTKDVVYTCGSGCGASIPDSATLRKFCKAAFRGCRMYLADRYCSGIYGVDLAA